MCLTAAQNVRVYAELATGVHTFKQTKMHEYAEVGQKANTRKMPGTMFDD